MHKYDGQRFSPAAPTGIVSITNPDTGSTLSGVSVLSTQVQISRCFPDLLSTPFCFLLPITLMK